MTAGTPETAAAATPAPRIAAGLRSALSLIVRLTVTVGILALVLSRVDMRAFQAVLANVSILSIVAALAIGIVQVALISWRWRRVMRAIGIVIGFGFSLRVFMISLFFNQALPSTIGGDAVRAWLLRRAGHDLGPTVRGVLIDRLTALVGLIVLIAALLPFLFAGLGRQPATLGVAALIVAALVGFAALMLFERLPLDWHHMRLVVQLAKLAAEFRRVVFVRGTAIPVIGSAIASHVLVVISFYILARGLGLPLGFFNCLLVIPPIILAITLPISIAGWGVREGAVVAGLHLVGISADGALALSVLYGLISTAVGLAGGPLWFIERRRQAT
ncbi:MAG: flippase-like domain-containing protein [Rhodospirillales bacterium]|nr:flippase-like domain-containing protein [Rhodospirillales bacterium]